MIGITNKHYCVADSDGRIIETYYIIDSRRDTLTATGRTLIRGEADPDAHYIVDGHITERPECPATLDDNVLTNLPTPCIITINNQDYECDEPEAHLEFDQLGAYLIRVIPPWPYLIKEFTYENTAQ